MPQFLVMSYDRWMESTNGGIASIRSSLLEGVDQALRQYHQNPNETNLRLLKEALNTWIRSKSDWRISIRNRQHSVEQLWEQLNLSTLGQRQRRGGLVRPITLQTPNGLITWTGEDAERLVELERDTFVETCFKRKILTWRGTWLNELIQMKKIKGGGAFPALRANLGNQKVGAVTNTANLIRLAADLIDSICPGHAKVEVMRALESVMPGIINHLAAELAPLAGIIASGGSAAWSSIKSIVNAVRISDAETHAEAAVIGSGSPHDAVQAVIRMMNRERNEDLTSAAISTGALLAKVGGLAAGDPVVVNTIASVAASIAKLTNIIRIIVRDVLEKNAGNQRMESGKVDLTIFDICPIIGCYYVALAPKSVLLNVLASQYGGAGWQDEAEFLIKNHIDPLQEQAVRIVRLHRFVIPGLQDFAGLKQKNKKELKKMRAHAGHSEMQSADWSQVDLDVVDGF